MQRPATRLLVTAALVLVAAGATPTAVGDLDRSGATVAAASPASHERADQRYEGAHVSLSVADRAVTDYAVGGETLLDSLRVGDAPLAVEATTPTVTRLTAGNATLAAHDNPYGVLVVASGNHTSRAVATLPAGATATALGDARVGVTTANGTEGTFLVVGAGEVVVDEADRVTARLGADARLVFRAYPAGRDDADAGRERLVADGAVAAGVHVMERATPGEGNASAGADPLVDVVRYDDETTVDATVTPAVENTSDAEAGAREAGHASNTGSGTRAVELAVDRSTPGGVILLASVAGTVLDASEGVTVTIDGDPATEAATYSQLEGAVGSDRSRYVLDGANGRSAGVFDADAAGVAGANSAGVTSTGTSGVNAAGASGGNATSHAGWDAPGDPGGGSTTHGRAAVEIAVAVNHFSERTVTLASGSGADEQGGGEAVDDATTVADARPTHAGSGTPSGDPATTAGGGGATPGVVGGRRGIVGAVLTVAGLAVAGLAVVRLFVTPRSRE